jgi:hypothetical protein
MKAATKLIGLVAVSIGVLTSTVVYAAGMGGG